METNTTEPVLLTRNALGITIDFANGAYLSSQNAVIQGDRLCVPSAESIRQLEQALQPAMAELGQLSPGTRLPVAVDVRTLRDLCNVK